MTKKRFAKSIKVPQKEVAPESFCHETLGPDERLPRCGDVRIHSLTELRTGPEVLIRDVYFEGGDVLRCYEGRFRFTFARPSQAVEIGAGEALIVYPNQRVTIEALEGTNLILYAIFKGSDVETYFDSFGFYDRQHGRTSTQLEVFQKMRQGLEKNAESELTGFSTRMSDALTSYAHDLRENGHALICDAVRQIRANLQRRVVRIEPLCNQLKVCRSYLHRAFRGAGLGSVADFIKQEQVRLALRLLRETNKSVSDISCEAGFLSVTHFATFMKRRTGLSPRALRHG